ncbi:RidA family protein [Ferrovibrio sp.]|uniref:RidA family protein n=1 Tax=Ferrovibrio sp. TaxID=1917215 RepID=UPI000CB17913|nr:RidA family protein [Ferrovibrio sp.]PJI44275.1 MAG: enamine deaminase RidA [Ferrovibrio sp.]
MQILNPAEWTKPKGYANGIAVEGRQVFIAGQIGWNAEAAFESDDLVDQTRQALRNIVRVLAEAGARPEHIVRLTWYVVDKRDYMARNADLGKVYREILGRHYPAMTLVQVASLLEDRAKIEIEATAVIPSAP